MATYWEKNGVTKVATTNRQAVALKWDGYTQVEEPATETVEAAPSLAVSQPTFADVQDTFDSNDQDAFDDDEEDR